MRNSHIVKTVAIALITLSSAAFADDLAQQMEEMIVMGAVKSEAGAQFELTEKNAETQEEAVTEIPVIEE